MMRRSLGLGVIALFVVSAAFGGAPPKKPKVKDAPLVCPVLGNKIASKSKAAGSYVYKGTRYYFCCPGCPEAFKKDPAKFVKAFPAKVKKASGKVSAAPAPHAHMTKVMVCPMTGEKATAGGGMSVVGDYEVHFCCPSCKPSFDKLTAAEKQQKIQAAMAK